MIPVDYELGKKIIETCTCECGAELTLSWGGAWNIDSYVLKCANDINHNRIARPATLGPYDIPGFNLFNLKGRRKQMEQELGKERAIKLIKYEGVVSLSKADAMEILQTIWPEAPELEVLKAAMICHHYGLNPLMKHVFLIPFKRRQKGIVVGEDWVTVLGIKATRLIAHRCGHFSYLGDTPRIMTEEEQKRIFGEVDNTKVLAITKLKDSKGNEAPGYGSWPRDEQPYGAEKGNTKANMAFIRSERNALDRLFAGEMPQGVEVIDEEYAPSISLSEGGDKSGGPEETTKIEAPAADTDQETFTIDPEWLKQSLKDIHWDEETARTWVIFHFKLKEAKGTLWDILPTLTRDQAQEFVQEINSRLEKQQASLF